MRIAYVSKRPRSGSRYKYEMMFKRLCGLELLPTGSNLEGLDLAIVEGDRCTDYKQALAAGVPYLLIQHDTASIRFGWAESPEERAMVENAAAILFTSEEHAQWMADRYKMPPYRVVHLRPFANDLDFEPLPKLPGKHLVYAGGIVPFEHRDGGFGYRAYHPIFKKLIAAGWTVHIYPAWRGADLEGDYADIGCILHDEVPQDTIYRELSQYTLGFQGYAETGPQDYIKGCRPNKLWEYLAAGIPTLGYNTGSGSKIYAGKWGVAARSLDTLPQAAERAARMVIDPELRVSEVMDNDIEIFREILGIALVAEKPTPAPLKPLKYPVRLAKDILWFHGRPWVKGQMIDEATAIAMKQAGHLTDPRIPVGCLNTEQTAEAVRH